MARMIDLVWDRDWWWALVKTAMNIWVLHHVGKL
jgi:hypothetical protein